MADEKHRDRLETFGKLYRFPRRPRAVTLFDEMDAGRVRPIRVLHLGQWRMARFFKYLVVGVAWAVFWIAMTLIFAVWL